MENKVKGFSLLEILIAMAIMAIMIAVAFPNLGQKSDKIAKQEILRLVAAIELVRDQSIIMNQEYGLNIDQEGYQFLVLSETGEQDEAKKSTKDGEGSLKFAKWKTIKDMQGLGKHYFPEGLAINLAIDGDNIFSSSEDEVEIFEEDIEIFEEDTEEKIEPPQIYFLSSGEQNQFSIAIAIDDKDKIIADDEMSFYRVRGFFTGDLKYEGPLKGNLFQDVEREYEPIELNN